MTRFQAVLLDAFGTLVELDRPYARLQEAVRRHLAAEIGAADAERAFRAEMAYYVDHCHEGRDAASLAALRERCAAIVLEELGLSGDPRVAARTLIEAIAFRVFDDVEPLLAGLRERAVPVAVVSNWDSSLAGTLADAGLRFDAVIDSASVGVRKPDPGIFLAGAAALGSEPARTLHVGDTPESDGAGARAAGMAVRILDRGGARSGADTIESLTEILALVP